MDWLHELLIQELPRSKLKRVHREIATRIYDHDLHRGLLEEVFSHVEQRLEPQSRAGDAGTEDNEEEEGTG